MISDMTPSGTRTSRMTTGKAFWKNLWEWIRVKELSPFGWKFIIGEIFVNFLFPHIQTTGLAAMNLILTAMVWFIPWWTMDFHTNCNAGHSIHYIVDVNVGVCEVSSHAEFHQSNCIHWDDKQTWEEIDQIANSQTTEYATVTFPHVVRLRGAFSGFIFVALYISIFALLKPRYSFYCQYVIILILYVYVFLILAMQIITGDNDVVSKEVWKAVTGCQHGSSIPYAAFYCVETAQVFGICIIIVATLPNRVLCFHLVNPRDGLSKSSFSLSSKQMEAEFLSSSSSGITEIEKDLNSHDSWKINYNYDTPPPAPINPRIPSIFRDSV